MGDTTSRLPGHDSVDGLTKVIEVISLIAAGELAVANVAHVVKADLLVHWWSLPVIVAAALGADLVSGLVHWTADTWFSERMPVLGRRFLRPFRVHHINPDDFLRRDFIDCNGDVAMLNVPILMTALAIPEATLGPAKLALVTFALVSLPTNQVHQWAHMPSPPSCVRWLQRHGVILSFEEHGRHHRAPYVANYCIATGWCNRWLTAIDFFPTLEQLITRLIGLRPRADEQSFAERW
jgi:ubiquitin-conjugating enzyme E2 variant